MSSTTWRRPTIACDRRLLAIVRRVPLPYPRFRLAALASLGEAIDWAAVLPEDPGIA